MKVFTSSDVDRMWDVNGTRTSSDIAEWFNELLRAHVKKHGQKVYGNANSPHPIWSDRSGTSHEGVLLFVRYIPKTCEHRALEFKEAVNDNFLVQCLQCGSTLKPKGWESVK